jgi:hypothetical protein
VLDRAACAAASSRSPSQLKAPSRPRLSCARGGPNGTEVEHGELFAHALQAVWPLKSPPKHHIHREPVRQQSYCILAPRPSGTRIYTHLLCNPSPPPPPPHPHHPPAGTQRTSMLTAFAVATASSAPRSCTA